MFNMTGSTSTSYVPSQDWSTAAAAAISISTHILRHPTSPENNTTTTPSSSSSFNQAASFANNQTYDYGANQDADDSSSSGGLTLYPWEFKARYDLPTTLAICIVLGAMIVATILGNIFVIVTILVEKSLQEVANYLILSLATTDLLVAISVTPISLANEVSLAWFLGNRVCDAWISLDVLCCTSSILHLVVISLDRYRAVSSIEYSRSRSGRKIICMLIIVWVLSVLVIAPPLFVRRKDTDTAETTGICLLLQDHGYTMFATLSSFWVPLVLVLVINYKIFQAAQTTIRKTNLETPKGVNLSATTTDGPKIISQAGGLKNEPPSSLTTAVADQKKKKQGSSSSDNTDRVLRTSPDIVRDPKELVKKARERKAARVIGIICGTFVVCWLPFCIVATVGPLCGPSCHIPPALTSAFLWLGYANSCLNPIIYTTFSPTFRAAFYKMAVCCSSNKSGN